MSHSFFPADRAEETVSSLLFCAIFINMGAKSSAQMGAFFYPMFAKCVLARQTMFVYVSEREIIFSPNCSKFAVE